MKERKGWTGLSDIFLQMQRQDITAYTTLIIVE